MLGLVGGAALTDENRKAEFERRALVLAETGNYRDHLSIEASLSAEFPEARGWLDRSGLRDDLNAACRRARVTQP
jgi:hypothetical protein